VACDVDRLMADVVLLLPTTLARYGPPTRDIGVVRDRPEVGQGNALSRRVSDHARQARREPRRC
jgi:hypothetical protein